MSSTPSTRNCTSGVLLAILLLCLTACSGRPTPAPVVEVYQGRTIHDFEADAYSGSSYTVKKGDTLYAVAWYSGQDYRDIARINGISAPYRIFPGQSLRLKAKPSTPSAKPAPRPKKPPGQTSKPKANQPVDRQVKQAYGEKQQVKKHSVTPVSDQGFPARVKRWVWPATGKVATSNYVKETGNRGIDIRGKRGDPVVAAADGKVVYTGSALRGFGQLVIVKHSDAFLSAYAHNDDILVKEQQWIKAGQQIASMGSSGTDTVKLRFEVRYKGNSVDPKRYLPKR